MNLSSAALEPAPRLGALRQDVANFNRSWPPGGSNSRCCSASSWGARGTTPISRAYQRATRMAGNGRARAQAGCDWRWPAGFPWAHSAIRSRPSNPQPCRTKRKYACSSGKGIFSAVEAVQVGRFFRDTCKVGQTAGVLQTPGRADIQLVSGTGGPASRMPADAPGFNMVRRTHVEGHAAARMRELGINRATLYINNPEICPGCMTYLSRMLPPGATLNVVLPNGTVVPFIGGVP
jgi:hypothetical protein